MMELSITRNQTVFRSIVLALISICLLLPFSNKAFHIDEVFYLLFGKYILENPFEPFLFKYFSGTQQFEHAYRMTHTPLPAYVNALVFAVCPQAGEKTFHTIYSFFFAALIVSFFLIARHFVRFPFLCSLFLLVSPALFLTSQSIYPDLAPLSLAMIGLAILLSSWSMDRKWWIYGFSSLFLILSWMMAYPLFLVTLISPLAGKIKTGGRNYYLGPALVSITFFGLLSFMTLGQEGSLHFCMALKSSFVVEPSRLMNGVNLLCNLGGCIIFPPLLLAGLCFINGAVLSLITAVLTLGVTFLLPPSGNVFSDWLLTPLFLWTGMMLVGHTFPAFKKTRFSDFVFQSKTHDPEPFFRNRGSDLFLASWILFFLLINIYLVAFGAVRYMVHLVPPLLLILFRSLEKKAVLDQRLGLVTSLILMTTLVLSLAISWADYTFAECYRSFFTQSQVDRFKEGPGTIYLVGKFGFRYYGGEIHGYSFYNRNTITLQEGDIIVHPRYCGAPLRVLMPDAEYDRLTELTTHWCDNPFPLRLVQYDGNAGFYCSLVGHLPYTISTLPYEEFSLYLIGKKEKRFHSSGEVTP